MSPQDGPHPARICAANSRGCRAFTLVELLVVVGVIAVLIALLLPALTRARQHAVQLMCESNLRQVTIGFLSYPQENRGWFPAPASGFSPPHVEDWIYWQPERDIRESRLLPYLGNSIEVLKCPLGPPERIPPGGRPPYPFSYSVNARFTGDAAGLEFTDPMNWGLPPCKLSQIVAASEKMLVIEEDITGINDGAWFPGGLELPDARGTSISVRHDRGREYGDWLDPLYTKRGRGNVGFADGHCEFISRSSLGKRGDPREVR